MIILLNLISLNNNIAQFDDRAVRRPGCATTALHDRAGWTGKNLILDEALPPTVLKELSHHISPILEIIFNKSLQTGQVPNDWKEANVAPIFKKGDKHNPSNYRPISLTCIISKCMEHILVSNIMQHLDSNKILYALQHGFR